MGDDTPRKRPRRFLQVPRTQLRTRGAADVQDRIGEDVPGQAFATCLSRRLRSLPGRDTSTRLQGLLHGIPLPSDSDAVPLRGQQR